MNQDATIIQSGMARVFIQEDGISPANPYKFFGFVQWDKTTKVVAKVTPIYMPNTSVRNKWDIVGRLTTAPELGKTGFTQHADRYLRDVWWKLKDRQCITNIQLVTGECQRPDQLASGDARLFYMHAVLDALDIGELNVLEGDKNVLTDITGTFAFDDYVPLRPIAFEQRGGATILSEVLDGVFYDAPQCGSCGPASDGCQKAFILTTANAGSPGLSSQIYYSQDGGLTWAGVDIPTLGGLSGNRLGAMGDKLIVVSQAGGNWHWALFSDILSGLANWTAMSSGLVSTRGPRAIYERNVNEAFVAAAGGYIYLMTDPTVAVSVVNDNTLTAQDQNDIHGWGRVVVSVGNSNTVLFSQNEGTNWQLLIGPAVGANLTTIWCLRNNIWFVGANNGKLFYTQDSGVTWTQINLPGGANVIDDLQFYDDTVGYLSVEVGGIARVFRTQDSGNTWQYQRPNIEGLPTTWTRVNIVVPCGWNEVLAGGRTTIGGSNGALAIAQNRPI
jgi:photosystem II stability/assembly factor-like uncharacterized protein